MSDDVNIEFPPLGDEELAEWLPRVRKGYAADLAGNGGLDAAAARAKAEADTERLFPGGRPSEGQFVFAVVADGRRAGEVWFGLRDDDMGRLVWVFSVEVDPAFRGRGLGRAAMEFVEAEARRRGYDRVSLNVMGGNTVARGLYRSLGYDEVALVLGKDV
jgi:ribosomal protein S18 acetylase RimI-like enzyme